MTAYWLVSNGRHVNTKADTTLGFYFKLCRKHRGIDFLPNLDFSDGNSVFNGRARHCNFGTIYYVQYCLRLKTIDIPALTVTAFVVI